jgi:hypothetical protein
MPVTVGAILAGGGAVANIISGASKTAKANRIRNKAQSFFEQNKYQIPEEAKAALGISQRQASGIALPGQDIAEGKLGQSTAQGIQAARQSATTPSQILASVTGLYGQQMANQQNLALQAAQNYQARQSQLQNQLQNMAQYENQKWQYNILAPYQQQLNTAAQLQGMGAQQVNAGIGGIANVGAGLASVGSQQQSFNQQVGAFAPQQQQPVQPWMSNNQYWGQ